MDNWRQREVTAAFSKCHFSIYLRKKFKNKKEGMLPLKRTNQKETDRVLYVDIWFSVILLNNLLMEGTQ